MAATNDAHLGLIDVEVSYVHYASVQDLRHVGIPHGQSRYTVGHQRGEIVSEKLPDSFVVCKKGEINADVVEKGLNVGHHEVRMWSVWLALVEKRA